MLVVGSERSPQKVYNLAV